MFKGLVRILFTTVPRTSLLRALTTTTWLDELDGNSDLLKTSHQEDSLPN